MGTTIRLSTPIVKGETEVAQLVFRDPKVGHMLAIDGLKSDSWAADLALVERLTGVPQILLKEIEPEDWAAVRVELRLIYARFTGAEKQIMAAVMALDLSIESFSQLTEAYAVGRGVPVREFLQSLIGQDVNKNP